MNGKELDLSKIADMISKTAASARDKLENQSDKMYSVGEDMMSSVGEGALAGAKSAAKNIEAAGDIITTKYQNVLSEINRSGKKKGDISSLFATITQIKRSDLNSFNALKDELKDIKAIFTDIGEVKGLDAILKQYGKTADKLRSIDFGFGSAFVARGRATGTKNLPHVDEVEKVETSLADAAQQSRKTAEIIQSNNIKQIQSFQDLVNLLTEYKRLIGSIKDPKLPQLYEDIETVKANLEIEGSRIQQRDMAKREIQARYKHYQNERKAYDNGGSYVSNGQIYDVSSYTDLARSEEYLKVLIALYIRCGGAVDKLSKKVKQFAEDNDIVGVLRETEEEYRNIINETHKQNVQTVDNIRKIRESVGYKEDGSNTSLALGEVFESIHEGANIEEAADALSKILNITKEITTENEKLITPEKKVADTAGKAASDTEKRLNAQKNQTNIIKEQVKATEDLATAQEKAANAQAKYMYHAGKFRDNGRKAESLGSLYPGRSTGFYGTGTYGVDLSHIKEISTGQYGKRPMSIIDTSSYNLYNATNDKVASSLHLFLQQLTDKIYGSKGSKRINALYSDFNKLFPDNTIITTYDEFKRVVEEIATYVSQNKGRYPQMYDLDSAPTMFMKKLGYEGINTLGTRHADTTYGTVIYDLKEESIICKEITDELQKQQILEGNIGEVVALNSKKMQEVADSSKSQSEAISAENAELERQQKIVNSSADIKKFQDEWAKAAKNHSSEDMGQRYGYLMEAISGDSPTMSAVDALNELIAKEQEYKAEQEAAAEAQRKRVEELQTFAVAAKEYQDAVFTSDPVATEYSKIFEAVANGSMSATEGIEALKTAIEKYNTEIGESVPATQQQSEAEQAGVKAATDAAEAHREVAAAMEQEAAATENLASKQYKNTLSKKDISSLLEESGANSLISAVPKSKQKGFRQDLVDFVNASFNDDGKTATDIYLKVSEMLDKYGAGKTATDKTYAEVWDYLKGITITIPEDMEKSFAAEFQDEWKQIKRRYGGNSKFKIRVGKGGTGADQVYEELKSMFPGIFSDEIINDADQLRRIIEVAERGKVESKLPKTSVIPFTQGDWDYIITVFRTMEDKAHALQFLYNDVNNSASDLAESSERTANSMERQAGASKDVSKNLDDSSEEENAIFPIGEGLNNKKALEMVSTSKKPTLSATVFDGITSNDKLQTAFQSIIKDVEQQSMTLVKSDILDSIDRNGVGTLKFVSDDMNNILVQTWKMVEGQLTLASEKYTSIFKEPELFDVEDRKKVAQAQAQTLRTQFKGFANDPNYSGIISGVETAAGNITDAASFKKFNVELTAAREALKQLKAEMSSSKSLDPLAAAEKTINKLPFTLEKIQVEYKSLKEFDTGDIFGAEGVNVESLMDAVKTGMNGFNDSTRSISDRLASFKDILKAFDQLSVLMSTLRTKSKESKDSFTPILNTYKELTKLQEEQKKAEVSGATDEKKNLIADGIVAKTEKLKQLGVDINDIDKNTNLTTEQRNKLLKAQEESLARIKKIEVDAANSQAQKEKRQSLNYGKGAFNSETRKKDNLSAIYSSIEDNYGASVGLTDAMNAYLEKYKQFETARQKIADPTTDVTKADRDAFNKAKIEVESARKALEIYTTSYSKLEQVQNDGTLLGMDDTVDPSKLQNSTAALKAYGAEISNGKLNVIGFNSTATEMYGTIDRGKGIIDQVTVALESSTGTLYAYKTATKEVGTAWEKFKGSLSRKTKELTAYIVSGGSIYGVINQVKKGITYVKEIDVALTELKKVTDETDETYNRFLQNTSKTAGQIGSTVKEFVNATADFARLGYNIEQASELAKAASVYYNVGDEIDNIGEASDSIISTMHGFGIEASNAMEIVDKFNEVGNNFAITSSGIGQALLRSASAMAEAGNTIDESIGLITAANSVVQNPETVGTAMKTLSLRIRGAKVELEDAGEDVDGMASSVSELQKKLLALTGGKVNIMLDENTFKNTTEILREMSAVWDDMTDVNRASALELLGGKRQANVLAAVIKNFDTVEDVIKTSSDAVGSAEAENEKYLNSIQGKIDQFNNAVQTMWMNFINADIVKFIVSVGTAIVQLVDKIGMIPTALTAIAAFKGFNVLIKNFKDIQAAISLIVSESTRTGKTVFEVASQVDLLSLKAKLASSALIKFAVDNGVAQASEVATMTTTQLLGVAFQGLILKLKAAGKAMLAFIKANPWVAVVAGVALAITSISLLVKTHKDYVNELKETSDEISDVKNNIQSLNDELKTTQDRIDELNKKDKLSFAEEEELKNLKAQNAELERSIRLAEQQEKRLQKKASMSLNKAVASDSLFSNTTWTKYVNSKGEQVDAEKAIDSSTQYAEGTYGLKEGYTQVTVTGTDFQKKIEQYKSAQESLKQAKDELEQLGDDAEDKEVKSAEAKVEQMQKNVDTTYDAISETMDKINEDYLSQEGVEWQYGNPDELEDWQKQMNANLKIIYDAQDKLAIASDTTGKAIESAFSRVSLQTEFQDELKTIQETVGITGEKLQNMYESSNDTSDTGIKAFIQSLIDCGVIANTSADELQKVVDLSLQLGGNTSGAAVANQKLARSQKMLQYYKQYKELNKYTQKLRDAKKEASSLTTEEKKQISTIRTKMQALASEISAYDILGDQINEAKAAFEGFENAKTADEDSDYLSTAGEMFQTVIKGYQSSEMGSDAFKSAFKSLIPESVYEDLDTLEERYTAAAEYISGTLSRYFKIEYDDDGAIESVETTTKHIETFIEDAKEKGLMSFSDGVWTVNETDFKNFADKMGITESMLVAIGEQIDKTDVDWIMGDNSSFFDSFDMGTEANIYKAVKALGDLDQQFIDGKVSVEEYTQKYNELQNELSTNKDNAVNDIINYDNATKNVDKLKNDLQSATEELKKLKNDPNATDDQIAEAAKNANEIATNLQTALQKKSELEKPSQMVVEYAIANIEEEKAKIAAELSTIDASIQLTTTDEDGNEQINSSIIKQLDDGTYSINVDANLTEGSKAKVQSYVDLLNKEAQISSYIEGDQGAEDSAENLKKTYEDLSQVINDLPDPNINTSMAQSAVNALKKTVDKLKDSFEDLPTEVTTTVTTINRTVNETVEKKSTGFEWIDKILGIDNLNGNAHFSGAANASGTLGADKTETSLVGELGPELRVRGNRWELIGENGAEFTDVKKGDIIFNHKQTQQLFENGYVNSRGKAFAGGTSGTIFTKYATVGAYGGTVPDWFGHSDILENIGNITDDVSGAANAIEDAADDTKQTIDFIEYRLEEIENSITNMTNRVENFLDNTSQIKEKNNLYEGLIDAEKQKASTYLAAAETYNKKAAQLLSEVPSQYQDMAKNGAITIKDFIGESEGAIADLIEEYRTWVTKAEDSENNYLSTIAEISAKRLEQLQDVADDFDNNIGLTERQASLLQGEMDILEEAGERLSENFYKELMKNSQKQIADLNNERAYLQSILDEAVKSGDVKVGSDDWYAMVNDIYDVDDSILECKKDIEGFQNSINDLYWDNLDKLIEKIDSVDSELSHLYNLVSDEEKVVDEFGNWTKDGVTALGLLAQQMEVANFKVEQYGEAIAHLEKDYAAGLYSTDEYNEKLAELKEKQWDEIEAQESAKKSIIDLNKTRIQAVKDGMQKEIDAYSELIDKKKEELNLQKESHDFSKQVAEQQKNIADIEKRLAVISGDNSASAIAQKKKLQAELAQAREELDELYYDHSVEKQQEALDKSLEDYQNNKQDEMDALDESLKNENQIIQDSYATIAANTELLAQNLTDIADRYGISLSDSVTKPWLDGANAIGTYQEQLDTSTSSFTDQLKLIKQELADLQVEADKTANSIINATNGKKDKTEGAKYTPPAPAQQPSTSSKPATPAPPSKGASVTVKKSATNFSRNGGNGTRMQSWVPGSTFTVYQVSGSEVLIGRNGGYTGWVKLSDIEGYAKGSKSIDKDQFAFLDELGEELQLVPDGAGRLSYVRKGTSIIPADLSERLMEWGQLDPSSVLEQSRPTVSAPHIINNNIELNMQIGEVVHIDRADNSSIPNITKAVQDQMDNYMKNINKKLYNRVR